MRAILTYHSIDSSGSPISVDRASFERHVAFLASGRVRVVGLCDLLKLPAEADAVALTFDDAFCNFADVAWPALEQAGLPTTMFVVTRRTGTDNRWTGADQPGIPTLPLMDWDQLRQLAREGLDIGSHSCTHPFLTQLDDKQLARELADSAADCAERLGQRPRSFCYPYGDHDARVARAAAAHYELACTTELATLPATPDPLRLPRLDAFYYRDAGLLERWGGTSFRAHLWLRATARGLRARLRRA